MQRQSLKLTARHRIGYLGHGAIEDGQYTVAGFDEVADLGYEEYASIINRYTNDTYNIGLIRMLACGAESEEFTDIDVVKDFGLAFLQELKRLGFDSNINVNSALVRITPEGRKIYLYSDEDGNAVWGPRRTGDAKITAYFANGSAHTRDSDIKAENTAESTDSTTNNVVSIEDTILLGNTNKALNDRNIRGAIKLTGIEDICEEYGQAVETVWD